MSVAYICLLALASTPLMANGRPAESISNSREARQYVSPVPAPWVQPYGLFRQGGFGRYPYFPAALGTHPAPVQERFGLALLLSLLGGGDGGDDRNPWNFRPLLANFALQMADPQPFLWPVTNTTLG